MEFDFHNFDSYREGNRLEVKKSKGGLPNSLWDTYSAMANCYGGIILRGGISDPRNKTLMKMFNMIGIGERAGSGVPDIFAVWESQGWKAPVVEEQYGPDRTILMLSFAKNPRAETNESSKSHPSPTQAPPKLRPKHRGCF